jgi:hypothetical protein
MPDGSGAGSALVVGLGIAGAACARPWWRAAGT